MNIPFCVSFLFNAFLVSFNNADNITKILTVSLMPICHTFLSFMALFGISKASLPIQQGKSIQSKAALTVLSSLPGWKE